MWSAAKPCAPTQASVRDSGDAVTPVAQGQPWRVDGETQCSVWCNSRCWSRHVHGKAVIQSRFSIHSVKTSKVRRESVQWPVGGLHVWCSVMLCIYLYKTFSLTSQLLSYLLRCGICYTGCYLMWRVMKIQKRNKDLVEICLLRGCMHVRRGSRSLISSEEIWVGFSVFFQWNQRTSPQTTFSFQNNLFSVWHYVRGHIV